MSITYLSFNAHVSSFSNGNSMKTVPNNLYNFITTATSYTHIFHVLGTGRIEGVTPPTSTSYTHNFQALETRIMEDLHFRRREE